MNARDRYKFTLYCYTALFVFSANVSAQQSAPNDAAKATESVIQTTQRIEGLRLKIQETQDKESKLQERISQIDEEMKPENLQKQTAGVGTTRPEELRDGLRRKLEAEKKALQDQIAVLIQSRTNLELAIATTQPAIPTANSSATNSAEVKNNPSKTEENRITTDNSTGKTQLKKQSTSTKRPAKKAKRVKSKRP